MQKQSSSSIVACRAWFCPRSGAGSESRGLKYMPVLSLAKRAADAFGCICAAPSPMGLLTATIIEITYSNKVNRQ